MKISTKGRYGLKAMVDLGVHSLGEQVSIKSIAQRQNISENYLEQVFSMLRKSGIVNSIKGPQGGYVLGREAAGITIGDILRCLEGSLSVVDELKDNSKDLMETCININVWDRINQSISSAVDSITLEDLIQNYKDLKGDQPIMYFI